MDKTLLRPLFQKRFMELHKPQGFVFGGGVAMQADQARQRQSGVMNLAQAKNIITNPSGMEENIEIQEKEPVKDVNITESVISGRENEKALNETNSDDIKLFVPKEEINERQRQDLQKQATVEKLGVEATSNPSLFSDAEKKGIFAANLALFLAQPGDPMANLATGLAKGAISLGDLNVAEAQIKKETMGKTKLMFDKVTQEEVEVPISAAVNEKIQVDGKMVNRYIGKPDTSKDSIESVLVNFVEPESGVVLKRNERVLKNDLANYLRGDYSKYKKGSLNFEKMDDIKAVVVKEGSAFGPIGTGLTLAPDEYEKFQKMGIVGTKLPENIKARILAEELYYTDQDKKRQTRLDNIAKDLTKTDEALFLVNDLKGKINRLGAVGGNLAALSRGIGQLKATGKFIFGIGDKKVPFDQIGKTGFIDPNYDKNMADIKKAILDPDQYINGVVRIGNEERLMTEQEKAEFRGATALFNNAFADLSAGLDTNVIQLAYAIAKANEEGGRFSVSDIQFAMQSIGNGADVSQFNSRLNTLGKRLSANAYKKAVAEYNDMARSPRDYIRRDAEYRLKNETFKRIEQNYFFYKNPEEFIKEENKKIRENLEKERKIQKESFEDKLRLKNEEKGKGK